MPRDGKLPIVGIPRRTDRASRMVPPPHADADALHITWENENTLRIDADAGTQTRRLLFNAATTRPR